MNRKNKTKTSVYKEVFKELFPEGTKEMVSRSFYTELNLWNEFKNICEENGKSTSETLSALIKNFIDKGKEKL